MWYAGVRLSQSCLQQIDSDPCSFEVLADDIVAIEPVVKRTHTFPKSAGQMHLAMAQVSIKQSLIYGDGH